MFGNSTNKTINPMYILGPGFTFDVETAHTEREVAPNGRLLRSDVTTLKRKAIRGLKKSKGK
jgi:hypothetical protein